MNWISKLERKFGRYAIQNLMFYVIALYTVGFALSLVAPEFYYQYLSLNIESGVSRADLEVSYIFDAAAKFECVVYECLHCIYII